MATGTRGIINIIHSIFVDSGALKTYATNFVLGYNLRYKNPRYFRKVFRMHLYIYICAMCQGRFVSAFENTQNLGDWQIPHIITLG